MKQTTASLLLAGSIGAQATYVPYNNYLVSTANLPANINDAAYLPGSDGLVAVVSNVAASVGLYYQYITPATSKTYATYQYSALQLAPNSQPDHIALVYPPYFLPPLYFFL
jgi:hypothetical protein